MPSSSIDLDIQKLHYRLGHLDITSLACAWPSTRHLERERERESWIIEFIEREGGGGTGLGYLFLNLLTWLHIINPHKALTCIITHHKTFT